MKNLHGKSSLNLNINKDNDEINDFLFCWKEFGSRPNKILIHNNYSTSSFCEVISKHSKKENQFIEIAPSDEEMLINEKVLSKIQNGIFCSYIIVDKNTDFSIVSELTFFFSSIELFDKIQKIIEELNSCLLNFDEENLNNLNTVLSSQSGFEIDPIDSCLDLENFDLFYSKQTMKQINKLIKEIKNSEKGLSILYGARGTGKTSVINYLASKINRIVIFIPNNMIDITINNPDFRKFLKRYEKPVIVIDDCEMLLNEYFNKSNIFSNNILQMVDGLLSDSISVNLVTIFNVENEDEIDHTLLECNNLLKKLKFESLSADESNELSEFLNLKKKYKNKNKVIDIIKNNPNSKSFEIGL